MSMLFLRLPQRVSVLRSGGCELTYLKTLEMANARRSPDLRRGKRLSIVVTGGAGFLGSYLCRDLVTLGHHVTCIDNLTSGRIANIRDILHLANFRFVKSDVVNPLDVSHPVDLIYNLACPASPRQYQIDPIQTFKTCIMGSLNVLELAKATGARVLQASTSEVYGDPTVSPQPETYLGNVNTCGPRSCYDEGKRGAETLFYDYHRQFGVDIRIARIFNTYGPDMSPEDGRVISTFVVQSLRREDLTVMGDGTQTRSFCFRDDLIEGLKLLMETDVDPVRPVNIGNPDEYTILELAKKVLERTQSQHKIVFQDLPQDDPRQRKPDISVAKQVLDWSPRISLDEGLDRTIAYFRREEAVGPGAGVQLGASGS